MSGRKVEVARVLMLMMCLFGTASGCADGSSNETSRPAGLPAGWVAIDPPAPKTPAAECASWAEDDWAVSLSRDSTAVQISRSLPPNSRWSRDTIYTVGGFLTGIDVGEFGGAIWWQGRDGLLDSVRVSGRNPAKYYADNLKGLFLHRGQPYALVGLAHLGASTGELLALNRDPGGRWRAKQVLDLGGAPEAYTWVSADTILVLTPDSVLAVDLAVGTARRRALHGSKVWWIAYPATLVRHGSGVFYIGLRGAVGRLTPTGSGYLEEWLVPAACPRRIAVAVGVNAGAVPIAVSHDHDDRLELTD
jgi:hypothetical protein